MHRGRDDRAVRTGERFAHELARLALEQEPGVPRCSSCTDASCVHRRRRGAEPRAWSTTPSAPATVARRRAMRSRRRRHSAASAPTARPAADYRRAITAWPMRVTDPADRPAAAARRVRAVPDRSLGGGDRAAAGMFCAGVVMIASGRATCCGCFRGLLVQWAGRGAAALAREAVAVLEACADEGPVGPAYSTISQSSTPSGDYVRAIRLGRTAPRSPIGPGVPEVAVHASATSGRPRRPAAERSARAGQDRAEPRAGQGRRADDDVVVPTRTWPRRPSGAGCRPRCTGTWPRASRIATSMISPYGTYLRAWRARQQLDVGRWRAAAELVEEVMAQPAVSLPTWIVACSSGLAGRPKSGAHAHGDVVEKAERRPGAGHPAKLQRRAGWPRQGPRRRSCAVLELG